MLFGLSSQGLPLLLLLHSCAVHFKLLNLSLIFLHHYEQVGRVVMREGWGEAVMREGYG